LSAIELNELTDIVYSNIKTELKKVLQASNTHFLAYEMKLFKIIELKYFLKGHSKNNCDRSFG